MPKYKVTYTFEVEVEAPNESIATINADYILDNDENEPYMWDYLTKREAVELKNKFEKNDPKCTCTNCCMKNVCICAWNSYNDNGECLLLKTTHLKR